MTDGAEPLLRFAATVHCRRDPAGPLGLTLVGAIDPDEIVQLSFPVQAPADLPPALEAPTVLRSGRDHYRVAAGTRSWLIVSPRAFLHRDVGRAFYRALPPRRAPWRRRLLWRSLIALVPTPLGRWWLGRPRE